MIDRTFLHCHGIGPKTDQRLKSMGFCCWQDCLERQSDLPFSGSAKVRFLDALNRSLAAREKGELDYLVSALPTSEHWRILAEYYTDATYFDIETTGLSSWDGIITVISAFHRGDLFSFVYDRNLDDFLNLVDQSKLLVAFNGNAFDIPFIENNFNIPDIGCPYIDLRWICYHQGYTGGLKSIERELQIKRPAEVRNVDGFEAVILFDRWQKGDEKAGEKLVRYCETDVLAAYLVSSYLLDESGIAINLPEQEVFFKKTAKPFHRPES